MGFTGVISPRNKWSGMGPLRGRLCRFGLQSSPPKSKLLMLDPPGARDIMTFFVDVVSPIQNEDLRKKQPEPEFISSTLRKFLISKERYIHHWCGVCVRKRTNCIYLLLKNLGGFSSDRHSFIFRGFYFYFFPNSVSFGVFSHSKGLGAKWHVCLLGVLCSKWLSPLRSPKLFCTFGSESPGHFGVNSCCFRKGSVEVSPNNSLHLSFKWQLLHKKFSGGFRQLCFAFISQSSPGVEVAWIVDISQPYKSSPQRTTHHVVAVGVFFGLIQVGWPKCHLFDRWSVSPPGHLEWEEHGKRNQNFRGRFDDLIDDFSSTQIHSLLFWQQKNSGLYIYIYIVVVLQKLQKQS